MRDVFLSTARTTGSGAVLLRLPPAMRAGATAGAPGWGHAACVRGGTSVWMQSRTVVADGRAEVGRTPSAWSALEFLGGAGSKRADTVTWRPRRMSSRSKTWLANRVRHREVHGRSQLLVASRAVIGRAAEEAVEPAADSAPPDPAAPASLLRAARVGALPQDVWACAHSWALPRRGDLDAHSTDFSPKGEAATFCSAGSSVWSRRRRHRGRCRGGGQTAPNRRLHQGTDTADLP